jgi:hypothetical protein
MLVLACNWTEEVGKLFPFEVALLQDFFASFNGKSSAKFFFLNDLLRRLVLHSLYLIHLPVSNASICSMD